MLTKVQKLMRLVSLTVIVALPIICLKMSANSSTVKEKEIIMVVVIVRYHITVG